MPVKTKTSSTPNPLTEREPELVRRLADFRDRVYDMLFDQLATTELKDPAFRAERRPYPPEDVQATALMLRVLTKPAWDADDMKLLDACWRQASHSELFAGEFEPERHRIRHLIEASRTDLSPRDSRQASGERKR